MKQDKIYIVIFGTIRGGTITLSAYEDLNDAKEECMSYAKHSLSLRFKDGEQNEDFKKAWGKIQRKSICDDGGYTYYAWKDGHCEVRPQKVKRRTINFI